MERMEIPRTELFKDLKDEDVESILICMSASKKTYKKGEYIFRMGDCITSMGIVLEGSVQIMREDFWGDRQILSAVERGQVFGESYACVQQEPLMVSVIATEASSILFLDINRILTTCPSTCVFHRRLIRNLTSIISKKNLLLTQKIDHMSKKTIREKVLSYLSFQAARNKTSAFSIPFDRQQLADYLAVDRSALSAELSKMQKEDLISCHKNQFTLYSKR